MDADFEYVRALLHRRAAIVLEPGKEYLMAPRLLGVANGAGFTSVSELVARLRAEPPGALHQKVVEAMTTNETTFFRDQHPFELLRTVILPRLIALRAGERRLRLWSAACSTGQEPYSLAMLVRHHFPRLADWDVRIMATDLSTEVVARAKEARYSQLEVGRGLPATMLAAYFERHGTGWTVVLPVRAMVDFRSVNLAEALPFVRQFDVVLLRNVLTYFDTPSREAIVARVGNTMREPGFLMLGSQESALRFPGLASVTEGRSSYFTRGEARHGAH